MRGRIFAGKYRVRRLLGEGGMGTVHEAEHTETGRRVALKVLNRDELTDSAEALLRFEREARAAGVADSEHVVQVLDAGREAATDTPFLVMEYLEGEDLRQILERLGPLPPDVALRIAAQACVGLESAHAAGIVHRDIKPANVFLARRDDGVLEVKILDFGIAKVRHAASGVGAGDLTETGRMLGSPRYMSPEQVQGLKTIDHRADIWSLGAVLYKCLTGRTPHDEAETQGQLMVATCTVPPPPIRDLAPWVPSPCAAVVHRALELKPDRRFPSAGSMRDAIRACLPNGCDLSETILRSLGSLERTPVSARAPDGSPTVVEGRAQRTEPTTAAAVSTRAIPERRRRLRWGLAAAVTAAVLGVTIYGRSRQEPPVSRVSEALRPLVDAPIVLTGTPQATPPAARTAQVGIAPSTAAVEVNGRRATVRHGSVEVTGALGSLHRVRVSHGGQTTVHQVALTEAGPVPSAIRLVGPKKSPAPTPSETAVVESGLDTKFE